jgi:hypothetical protein
MAMIEAGATRIGASSGVAILEGHPDSDAHLGADGDGPAGDGDRDGNGDGDGY